MGFSKLYQAALFASMMQLTSASELCQDSNDYDSTAIASQYCMNTYTDETTANSECPDIDECLIVTVTGDDSDTYYCYCSTYDLSFDCPLTDPEIMTQNTCGDSEDDWDYSTSSAEAMCESDGSSLALNANNCCNGGYSVCEDYTSQLCSSSTDYEPVNYFNTYCYEVYDSDEITTYEEASALCTDSSCFVSSADFTNDGIDEYFCVCETYDECPLSSPTVNIDYICAGLALDKWSYNNIQSTCASNHEDFDNYAKQCCSSQESVCAGYCVSSDSTVSKSVDDQTMVVVTLSEVQEGDKILAWNNEKQVPSYSKVSRVMKSKSTGDFYNIEVHHDLNHENSQIPEKVRATPHHTFPICHDKKKHIKDFKYVEAAHLKEGDCVMSSTGEMHVKKITKESAQEGDETYTIGLENSDIVYVGGIATHSQHVDHHFKKHDGLSTQVKKAQHIAPQFSKPMKKSHINTQQKLRGGMTFKNVETFEKLMKTMKFQNIKKETITTKVQNIINKAQ